MRHLRGERRALTHEHGVADIVVRTDVLARVRDRVYDAGCEAELGQVANKAGEDVVVDRGQLRAIREEDLHARV